MLLKPLISSFLAGWFVTDLIYSDFKVSLFLSGLFLQVMIPDSCSVAALGLCQSVAVINPKENTLV